ncbi:MAG: DNA repair protein RecO [Acidobacteriota bacterium]
MSIYEDEAIVLRQYPLADSDSIVVSIGPQLGKIRTVAQGIKKPKSRLAGCLEPMNHIRLSLYLREGKDLGRIQHAELIHSYSGRIGSLNHILALSYFTEIVHVLVQDNQPNPTLFRLLLASLKAGEKRVPILPLIRYFEVWCLKINGSYKVTFTSERKPRRRFRR